MIRRLFSRGSEQQYPAANPDSRPNKTRLVLIVALVGVLFVGVPLFLIVQNKPDKYTQSALEAARRENPNAEVENVNVSGGFAIATVSDPTSDGQIKSGNVTIFRLNDDGSMTQIASGSSLSPLYLLTLGVSLETQSELMETDMSQTIQNLKSFCGYRGGDAPGFSGFEASFNPDNWQIDSTTFNNLSQVLTSFVSNNNVDQEPNNKTICINATKDNSNATTDMNTFISTFTLSLQFVQEDGSVANHSFKFSIGPNRYQQYILDDKRLSLPSN